MDAGGCAATWLGVVHVALSGLAGLLTIWLAHRRKVADRERRKFYWQMRQKHGLPSSDGERAAASRGEFIK